MKEANIMPDILEMLISSIPEAIGGLVTATIIAILGLIFTRRSRKEKAIKDGFYFSAYFVNSL